MKNYQNVKYLYFPKIILHTFWRYQWNCMLVYWKFLWQLQVFWKPFSLKSVMSHSLLSFTNMLSKLWLFEHLKLFSLFFRFYLFIFRFYLFIIFRERGKEGKSEEEKHGCVKETLIGCLLLHPNQGLTHNPDMCPEQESNWQPFSLQDDAQPTEPHCSGNVFFFPSSEFL